MAEDLAAHAAAEQTICTTRLTAAQQGLTDAYAELDRRVADPAAVPLDQRRSQLGAAQYLEQATLDDVALRAAETELRTALAAIPTPDSADPVVVALGDNLIAQAGARVALRDATERAARARAATAHAQRAVELASAAAQVAATRLSTATQRQQRLTQLTDSLTDPPLDSVVADATTLRSGAGFTAAENRLAALLPATLLTRAEQRAAESREPATGAAELARGASAAADALVTGAGDPAATLALAGRRLDDAEQAVRGYAGSAADRLARIEDVLVATAALPGLSAAEAASIDEAAAERADAVAAVPLEATLAGAVRGWAGLDRAVTLARVAALAEDVDRDPDTAQPVIDAIAARDDPAVLDPLADARVAYDAAAQSVLDGWEVEVPPWLWSAAVTFFGAGAQLDVLADGAARTALIAELDAAIDAYAAAADEDGVFRRTAEVVGGERDRLRSDAELLSATSADRFAGYVRGDARGGRHALEV